MFRNKNRLALFLGAFALLMSGVFFWKASPVAGTINDEEYNQGIRNALAEINFPTGGDAAAVNASSDNLANFIYYRSGIQISQTNVNLLRQAERQTWRQSKRITQSQLARLLTDAAFVKLAALSDADINALAESFGVFRDANESDFKRKIQLRANGEGTLEPEYFISQLKLIKTAAADDKNKSSLLLTQMSRTALYNRALSEISRRSARIAAAEPNFFGNAVRNMTPLQALLLTYSIVTDDSLNGNREQLKQKMADSRQSLSRYLKRELASAERRFAYGADGYLYASPTDFLLDDAMMREILNSLSERISVK